MSPLAVILFAALSALAVGALAYALLLPRIAMEKKAEARLQQFKGRETDATSRRQARERVQEVAKRRKSIEASLKAVEEKQKQHDKVVVKLSLQRRIEQAGLTIGKRSFILFSVLAGILAFLIALILGFSLFMALPIAFLGGYALPRFVLSFLRKKRQKAFVEEFANAVDVIVRGVKSGLPLNDTLRIVASEAKEPVRSEFLRIVEAQQVGLTISEAVERLYQNMPMPETNFFSIVISIQSQAGGNLSEALSNLSRVLRDRQKMKAKIQAMSMEAKASGAIIGSLPVIVALLVYLTTPDYITTLFITATGQIILIASALWMATGIFVMKQMIAFDF